MSDTLRPGDELEQPTGPAPGAPPTPEQGEVLRSSPLRLIAVVASVVALGIWASWSLVFVIVALVVSIYLHELGHYVVARMSGMKVTEFFLGFGPRIWSFQRGDTEYGIKAIPAGAYVRIIGMSNIDPVAEGDEARSYSAQSYPKRLATVLAGPAMNILLAFVVMTGVFLFGGRVVDDGWTVSEVLPGSAAAAAGIRPGDRVLEMAGSDIRDFADIAQVADDHAGAQVDFLVDRGGEEIVLTAQLSWGLNATGAAALPSSPPLPAGTLVRSVDGESVASYDELRRELASDSGERELIVDVAGGTYSLPVATPLELPEAGDRGFIGVVRDQQVREVGYGPVGAVKETGSQMVAMTDGFVEGMGRLFSFSGLRDYAELVASGNGGPAGDAPELTPVQAGSPRPSQPIDENRPISIIGIVNLGNQVGEEGGIEAMLMVLASVNLVLAFINLVPLPPFDGGHAAVATYEAIRGAITHSSYRADMAKLLPLTYAVVVLLAVLGLSSMYLDVVNPVELP